MQAEAIDDALNLLALLRVTRMLSPASAFIDRRSHPLAGRHRP